MRMMCVMVLGVVMLAAVGVRAEEAMGQEKADWTMPKVVLSVSQKHPVIAATGEEIERLKAAWKGKGEGHTVMAERFGKVDGAMKAGLVFPPEGGQHNQWYQCDKCQVALKTVDATHHQCPQCKTIYSGFPYDNVLYSKIHANNAYRAEDAAWAWTITGEKKYAEFAAQILTGYAERYLKYPMVCNAVSDKNVDVGALKLTKYQSAGHINEQTLGEAMWLIPFCNAYDLINEAGVLSEAQKAEVEGKLIRAMADCIDVNKAGKSNWQTWHNAALMYAGAVLRDEKMVRKALTDPKNGFVFQMREGVLPEGMWHENSWGYHYYTLTALTFMAEGARRMGFDLYGQPMLKRMYLVAMDYKMADGSLPRWGDAVQDTVNRPGVNEAAYGAYQNERLLATLSGKATWDSIMLGRDMSKKATGKAGESKVMPGGGHAVLATEGAGKLTAAMPFGPFGGFHGHFDKLTFVFFGYGQELGVDPGRAASQAYRLPIHKEWYRATVGHNGVLVDGAGQKEAEGKLISFGANKEYAAVAASAGPAFANAEHKRLLVLMPGYLVVVDELTGKDGAEHTFDWLYHNVGTSVKCLLPEGKEKLGEKGGYKYVTEVKSYESDGEAIRVTLGNEKVETQVTMVGQKGDQVFTGLGVVKSVTDRAGMMVVRRKGAKVYFVTVLEPVEKGKKGEVVDVKTEVREKGMVVEVQRNGGLEQILLDGGFGEKVMVFHQNGDEPRVQVLDMEGGGR